MLNDALARHGAAAAQGLIRSYGSNIAADGIWSTLSQGAYTKLTGEQASRVNAVVAAATDGKSGVADLAKYRDAQRQAGRSTLGSVDKTDTSRDSIKKLITAIALEEGVPPSAALQFCRVESNFNPKATSRKRDGSVLAAGLFQLTDGAIRQIGIPAPKGDIFDPEWNTRVGIKYMKWVARFLNTTFDNVGYIYAGYNLGVGNVKKLQQGQFDHPAVISALSQQAAPLRQGGSRQYLANATKFVSAYTV